MIKLLLSLTLFSFSAQASYLFIGNGGEGTLGQKGQIVVRDLYEEGSAEAPYIGQDFNPSIVVRLRNHPSLSVDYDVQLLARKLNDLEALSPGTGRVLLGVILFYRWDYTNHIQESPDSAASSNLSLRFPLAFRLQKHISIDRELWLHMDRTQQVALIIHEAIYSLLPLESYDQKPFLNQSAIIARNLTGRLFRDPSGEQQRTLASDLVHLLQIPSLPNCDQDVGHVSASLYQYTGWAKQTGKLIGSIYLPGTTPRAEIKSRIKELCSKADGLFQRYSLRFEMTREPFFVNPKSFYQTMNGRGKIPLSNTFQFKLRISRRSYKIASQEPTPVDRFSCANKLIAFYEEWTDHNSYMEESPTNSCTARSVPLQWQ